MAIPQPVLCALLPPPPFSHAIVSTSVGPEYYVTIMSFVDKTQLEPGCSVLLHNKVSWVFECECSALVFVPVTPCS